MPVPDSSALVPSAVSREVMRYFMARALLAVGALYPNISLYGHQYVLIPTSQSDKPLVVYSVRVLAKAETPCGYLTFIPLLDISASCMRLWLL